MCRQVHMEILGQKVLPDIYFFQTSSIGVKISMTTKNFLIEISNYLGHR